MDLSLRLSRAGPVFRIFIGLLFLWAGVWKSIDGSALHPHMVWLEGSGVFGAALAPVLGIALPGFEVLLGVSLILGVYTRFWLGAAIAFLATASAYTIAAVAINGARYGSCGCFGLSYLESSGLLAGLVRNAILVTLSLLAFRRGASRFALDSWHTGRKEGRKPH